MNDKPNPSGSLGSRSGNSLRIPQMPLEWLDGGVWRLPSGKALSEFALQAGFLAPLLFNSDLSFGSKRSEAGGGRALGARTRLGKAGPR